MGSRHEDFRQALARLTAIAETRSAMIRADPIPAIEDAHKRMAHLHQVLLDVEAAINDTNYVFDVAAEFNVPIDHFKSDHLRLEKARAVLYKYFRRDGSDG